MGVCLDFLFACRKSPDCGLAEDSLGSHPPPHSLSTVIFGVPTRVTSSIASLVNASATPRHPRPFHSSSLSSNSTLANRSAVNRSHFDGEQMRGNRAIDVRRSTCPLQVVVRVTSDEPGSCEFCAVFASIRLLKHHVERARWAAAVDETLHRLLVSRSAF